LIYVNFNYRLGPLGFPQGQEADDRSSLNLALKDELIALEWVQLHIETFGGDKTKVHNILLSIQFTQRLQLGHRVRPERGLSHDCSVIPQLSD
jgi:hypothetical protein